MGTGVSPPPWSPNWGIVPLASAAASRAEALDLASFRRRHVVRSATHLAHEPLLLHLAAEVSERLLELRGILYNDAHNPPRIAGRRRPMLLLQHIGPHRTPDGDDGEPKRIDADHGQGMSGVHRR